MYMLDKDQLAFMYRYVKDQRLKLTGLLFLIGISMYLQLYNPLYIRSFIDMAHSGEEQSVLAGTAIMFLLLSLLRQMLEITIQYMTSDTAWEATNRLRRDVAQRCLSYDLSFHSSHSPGEMMERIDGDIGKLNNFLSAFALKALSSYLLVIGVLIALWRILPLVGLAASCSVVLGLIVLNKLSRYGSGTIRHYLGEAARYIGFMDERIAGREDIRAFKAQRHVMSAFYAILRGLYRVRKQTGFRIATVHNAGDVVQALIVVTVLGTMGLLYLRDGALSLGTMFLVYFYMTLILVPLKNMAAEVSDLQHVHAAWQRICELLHYETKVENTGTCELAGDSWSVRFDEVSFGYDAGTKVLNRISLEIPAGKTVGIIGRTGSGKSTLVKLLYRLCDAQEGAIFVNGVNSKHVQLGSLRAGIAVVSQNVELFEGTLRNNITMFKEQIGDVQIWDALDRLSLSEWVRSQPSGLDRSIERDGRNLSSGEAQLIAFARVFLKRPAIVIMDEATSKIDPLTEKLIERSVVRLMKPCTAIVIAHKLSAIRQTDYMMVLRNGEVVEFGETARLAGKTESVYAAILEGEE
jgi:ATP-binding cassette subfamily B protein